MIAIRAFYKFVAMTPERADEVTAQIKALCEELEFKGAITFATEGINGTVSASPENMEAFWRALTSLPEFPDVDYKDSSHEEHPFRKLRIRHRKEIITIKDPAVDPTKVVGTYVSPAEWNDLISDPDVLVLDTRNHYEYVEGTFEGAVDPNTRNFSHLPAWVDQNLDPSKVKKVAMFCTGGIRCEKASAMMLQRGFKEVYHLKGGILKYLEEIPEGESKFTGSCFIFDDRDAILTGLKSEKRKFDQNKLDETVEYYRPS
ncbi:MAG: hypothetical protein GC165_15540 [Armatimonadetes bacterium]|nr:hypothetical protein [Armatimonadota bacterium]